MEQKVQKPTMAEQLRERFYNSNHYKEFEKVYLPFEKYVMDNLVRIVKEKVDDDEVSFDFTISAHENWLPTFLFSSPQYLSFAALTLKKRLEKEGFEVKISIRTDIVYITIDWLSLT